MRQISFVLLITLTVVGLTGGLGRSEVALAPTNVSVDSQEIRLAQAPTLSQSAIGNGLIMAQNMAPTKPDKPKDKPSDQTVTQTSDRTDNYQCLEYCDVVRQSCEVLATIQPDTKISTIGSKENNEWSRECQKIYNKCMNKCDIDGNNIHWKRGKFERNRNHKRGDQKK